MAGGKKDPINELSQKMLAGWILMAESCPIGCNVPLVENKKQGKIMCVSCDRHFLRDASTSELKPLPADTPLAVPTSTITPQTSGSGSHSHNSERDTNNNNNNNNSNSSASSSSYLSSSIPYPFTPSSLIGSGGAKRPPLSSAGELLLDAPAPSSSTTKRRDYDYGGGGYGEGSSEEEDADEPYIPPSDEELARHEERRRRNDKVSVEIGSKLLAGWTMLDTHCPSANCRTVLMKDNHNQRWCLACNTMIVTQEEYDAAKHVNVGPKSELSSARSSPPVLNLTDEYVERRPSVVSEGGKPPFFSKSAVVTPRMQTMQSPHVRSVNSAGQAILHSNVAPSPLLNASPPVFAPPLTHNTQVQIVDNTLLTLYQKLNEYTRVLSITTDLEESRRLCELIRECGLAIAALSGVYKGQK